jgi:lambda family phage minor tail protein L
MPDKIKPDTAKTTVQEISKEVHALEADAIISLYEIDISEIKKNLILGSTLVLQDKLRFHNMEVLNREKIYFKNEAYHALPILTEGFEISSSSDLPRPTITFVPMKGIDDKGADYNFTSLKQAIISLDNMAGAKVTRCRTFLKYLDASNNIPGAGQHTGTNPEFPREIYYINRKISESKSSIQLELSSVLDLENFKIPSRLCLSNRCPFSYRGEGCAYEYSASDPPPNNSCENCPSDISKQKERFGNTAILPQFAPPIAGDDDVQITGFGEPDGASWVGYAIGEAHTRISGEYQGNINYPTGAIVFVEKNDIRYYYMSKGNSAASYGPIKNIPPPNSAYWYADRCSKSIAGCKYRWGKTGAAKYLENNEYKQANNFLMFGGFPGTNSKTSIQ